MLKHKTRPYDSGCYIIVYPRANVAFAELAAEYAVGLARPETFRAVEIEHLLEMGDLLTAETGDLFRERYLLC
jgi:hypothetical protein